MLKLRIVAYVQLLGCVPLFAIPWTVAHQAPLSMGFLRQEYWKGLPFPSAADLPDPGIEPVSPELQVDSLPLSHLGTRGKQTTWVLIRVAMPRTFKQGTGNEKEMKTNHLLVITMK